MAGTYTLLYVVGLCAYLPRAAWTWLRGGGTAGLAQRLGRVPGAVRALGPGAVWIHAVSVGEVRAARGLLPHLRAALPGTPLALSTTTPTGQALAREAGADATFYCPLDLPPALAPYLEALRPRAVLLVETEIWPNLLRACHRRGVPVAVVNGRLSERSFRRYRKLGRWWTGVLGQLAVICARSQREAARFRALGAPSPRVFTTGNLKGDAAVVEPPARLRAELAGALGLNGRAPVLVAGCTMPGEEALVLRAFAAVRRSHPGVRLLLAPRHAERFDAVARAVAAAGWSCRRRTGSGPVGADVLLLDSLGELPAAYGLGTASFVGGSLLPHGGHNLLEPAICAQPVLFGPHVDNFASLARELLASGGGIQVRDADELARAWTALLGDAEARRRLGRLARRLALRDATSGRRTAAVLARHLGWPPA